MNIQPLVKNIKSLIGDQSSYFSIPDYQRPYKWKDEKIDDFWNDIVTAYDNNEENYFLGSFILIKRPDNHDFEVVDGQQRLITITILLATLRDYFAKHKKDDLANKIQDEFIYKDEKYRLQIRPEDRLNFQNYILKNVGSLDSIKNSSLPASFTNAVKHIKGYIRNKEDDLLADNKGAVEYLENFYAYFMEKVLVVNIVAEDLSSAYTIFETINNRGERLETDELLKNFLLKRLQDEIKRHNRENQQAEKNFESEKHALLENYKYIKNIAGEDIEMQELLRHHWTAMVGVKPRKNLYKEIINYIKGRNISSEDFIREWKQSADCYASLDKGSGYTELSNQTKNNLKLLWGMSHWEWLPVLIAARRNNMEKDDFEKLVYMIERKYALFWIAGFNAAKIKNPTMGLIRDYINKEKSISEIRPFIENTMRKSLVLSRFKDSIAGGCYGQSWCRYVLAKYEYSLTDDAVSKEIDSGVTQIEHILPQTVTDKYWKQRFTGEEHEGLVNSIGNLTLLIGGVKGKKKSKNQAAANKPFKDKLSVYMGDVLNDRQSAFRMTQDLGRYDEWTPSAIISRGRKITDKLQEEWDITSEEIRKEKAVDMGKEMLIPGSELTAIKEIIKKIKLGGDLILEEIPSALSKENIWQARSGRINESWVNLISDTNPLWVGFWRGTINERPAHTYIYIEWKRKYEKYLKQLLRDNEEGECLSGWEYNSEHTHFLFCRADFSNEEDLLAHLKEAVGLVKKYSAEFDEIEEDEDGTRYEAPTNKGSYPEGELKNLLEETLDHDSPLTPRFISFLEILLSENRSFDREEIKKALYKKGVGDDIGRTGAYLSNISQLITKDASDHLRQVIDFEFGGEIGDIKNNYIILDKYRDLVKDVVSKYRQ